MAKLHFFRTFLRNPGQVGAILPSGEALSRAITAPIDFASAKVVVEFGPGTGVFTGELAKRMPRGGRVIAVEINPAMADVVERTLPQVDLVRDSAENLRAHLEARGIASVDAVVSGLPFANFPADLRDRILGSALAALRDGGQFLSFTYYHSYAVPTTYAFRRRLKELFGTVEQIPVLMNIPPAYVFRCVKGRREDGPPR